VQCEYHPDIKELHLLLCASQPAEDCALELWSLDYTKGVFEAEYGVKLVATLALTPLALS